MRALLAVSLLLLASQPYAGAKPPAPHASHQHDDATSPTPMKEKMKKMKEQMRQIREAKDPIEKRRLMDEHMAAMKENMAMMRGGMGGMGGGGMQHHNMPGMNMPKQ